MNISIIIGLGMTILGTIILLIGIKVKKWFDTYTKKCTKKVMAKISGGSTFDMGMIGELDRMEYIWFSYIVDGKEYNTRSKYAISPGKYKEGEEIEILYNPDNPEEIYNDKDGAKYGIIVPTILGSCLLIFGIIIFIASILVSFSMVN